MLSQNRAILHIDDDPLILRVVGEKLKKWGYETQCCTTPAEGLRLVEDENIRVVLLDVDMPEMNGIETLERIKKLDGGIEVILLTGVVNMSTILSSHRRGAQACLFKPIDDYKKLQTAIEATFQKLDRWWECLQEMQQRKEAEGVPSTTYF